MNLAAKILNENPIGFAALARRIESRKRDGTITPQACWRWHTRGVRRRDGTVVKLEAVFCAGRYLTSYVAYERFVIAQNETADSTPLPVPPRSPSKRQREDANAAQILESAGI